MISKIRILIVEDSAFMRQFISNLITSDSQFEVIGTARNGEEGVQMTLELQPDVITMDVEMPVMDGLTAVKRIMEELPTPIVMLSSLTVDGASSTFKALEFGAVDFVAKPSGAISLDLAKVKEELFEKIKIASRAKIARRKPSLKPITILPKTHLDLSSRKLNKIIAIGTSTGGPKALQEIIPLLPQGIPAGILIVQHMPKGFTKSLAERLDHLSQIKVKEAEQGDELLPGVALIAPGDFHMTVNDIGGRVLVNLSQEPPISGHRPSVDIMFKSVAELKQQKIGVILTGMGGDGSNGMVMLKGKNAKTIAQNEESCIVFGMPKVAIEKKAIDNIVPLQQIAMEILKLV